MVLGNISYIYICMCTDTHIYNTHIHNVCLVVETDQEVCRRHTTTRKDIYNEE